MLPSQSRSLQMVETLIHSRCATVLHSGGSASLHCFKSGHTRSFYHVTSRAQDQRSRVSKIWLPSGGVTTGVDDDSHSKLLRAGFLRQAHSGIFHMLPLGYRVQEKIERLIDRHMTSLGASRLDLSCISSQYLWATSGRFKKVNSELFLFKDRNGTGFLLSPTHEEEITSLVANTIKSYKNLPARLYQISRKYRDERRPRHGLLRSREFIMKDLYTFDSSKSLALVTYELVRKAYSALFDELKIPYLIAEADSGDMGGNLSHEFHFLTSKGEDRVISCRNCDYVANEELAKAALPGNIELQGGVKWSFIGSNEPMPPSNSDIGKAFSVWRGLSRDRTTLVNVWYALSPSTSTGTARPEINTHAVKRIIPDLDPGAENAAALWKSDKQPTSPKSEADQMLVRPKIINLVDHRLPPKFSEDIDTWNPEIPIWPESVDETGNEVTSSVIWKDPSNHERLDLLRIQKGDTCLKCGEGQLDINVAIELGHTFFLGTRYSEPLNAVVTMPSDHLGEDGGIPAKTPQSSEQVPMQMGCHGIGVSRMIGAVAETLADEKGLNWPRVIAPYEVVVVPTRGNELDAVSIYDALASGPGNTVQNSLDVILDDRDQPFPWKMKDADWIGYPVIVIVGKDWEIERMCEVQCRRLGIREIVSSEQLLAFVEGLLVRL